jgi:hypothetical protein
MDNFYGLERAAHAVCHRFGRTHLGTLVRATVREEAGVKARRAAVVDVEAALA